MILHLGYKASLVYLLSWYMDSDLRVNFAA